MGTADAVIFVKVNPNKTLPVPPLIKGLEATPFTPEIFALVTAICAIAFSPTESKPNKKSIGKI